MNLLTYRIPVCLATVVVLILQPQAATALNLENILSLAIENDAQFQAETFDAQAQKAEGWRSVAGLGPSLIATGKYMSSRDSLKPDTETDAEADNKVAYFAENEISIELQQPLIDMEKINMARRGNREMVLADLMNKKSREDLIIRVYERYYDILSAQENLKLAQTESKALEKQVQTAKEKFELGYGTITDQYDSEARYHISQATEVARKAQLDDAREAMTELIDIEIVEDLKALPQDSPLPAMERDIEYWLRLALNNNTDLKMQQLQAETALLNLRAAQSRFLPTLKMFAEYTRSNPDDGLFGYGEERSEADIGLKVQMDLLAGGTDTAAAFAAKKRSSAARQRIEQTRRSVSRSVKSIWESLHSTHELVVAYEKAALASEKALQSTEAGYQEGVKVLLDVLNAQREYFTSKSQYQNARYDYMVLHEKFLIVVGRNGQQGDSGNQARRPAAKGYAEVIENSES